MKTSHEIHITYMISSILAVFFTIEYLEKESSFN